MGERDVLGNGDAGHRVDRAIGHDERENKPPGREKKDGGRTVPFRRYGKRPLAVQSLHWHPEIGAFGGEWMTKGWGAYVFTGRWSDNLTPCSSN